MSLKSRLLSKKNKIQADDTAEVKISLPQEICLLDYFEEHDEISELRIYSFDKVFIKKNDGLIKADFDFKDNEEIKDIIDKIANQYDIILNTQTPSFNITLPNNIKINAIIPPMVKKGYYLSLKRIAKPKFNASNILEDKVLSSEMILFLKECINMNLNIFIAGEANTDKNGVLNYIANEIKDTQSIITVEAAPCLKIRKNFVLKLIKYKNNFQKIMKKAVSLKQDRIIVSDANMAELVSLYEYINSGYNGFLISFSTKSQDDILTSLQNLILINNPNFTEQNAAALIASSMDIIIYVSQSEDGNERVTQISEIIKTKNEFKLQNIFAWKKTKSKIKKFVGNHYSTGIKSKYYEEDKFEMRSFLPEYFEKDHKHTYIGSGKLSSEQKLSKIKSQASENAEKYKILKNKIKKISD